VVLSYDITAGRFLGEAVLQDQRPVDMVLDSLLTSDGRGLLVVMTEASTYGNLPTAVIDATTAATVMDTPFDFDEAVLTGGMTPTILIVEGAGDVVHAVAKAVSAPLQIWSALPDGPVRRVVEIETQHDAIRYREALVGFTGSEGEARMLLVHHNTATVRPPNAVLPCLKPSFGARARGCLIGLHPSPLIGSTDFLIQKRRGRSRVMDEALMSDCRPGAL
jgi:hypothetical protein